MRRATPADLQRMLPLLDEEFILGRGRTVSLAQRFPGTFCGRNAANLFLTESDNEVVSALASRKFRLQQRERQWHGAMIGTVYTRPERRGEGWAGKLMEAAAASLRDDGCDFAVLWTTRTAFYAAHGWQPNDNGVVGESVPVFAGPPSPHVARMRAADADCAAIERIRSRCADTRVARTAEDYRQLPPPAEAVDLIVHESAGTPDAFALVGKWGRRSILYELAGDTAGFSGLWSEAGRDCDDLLVNDVQGSASQRWLTEHARIAWQDKPLAMWLPLSPAGEAAGEAGWYISFFDRI